MRALHFEESGHFQVQPVDLWPLLSDTGRLNRVIGLQAVQFRASPRADGGSVVTGEYSRFGITIARWTEHAFNFVRPQRYSVLREYSKGPLVRLDGGVTLTPDSDGTTVTVFADVIPRNLFGSWLAKKIVGPTSTSRVLAQCRIFEQVIHGQGDDAFPQLSIHLRVNEGHLNELIARLQASGADEEITRRLRDRLRSGSDERVTHMRAFEAADEWGTDRYETLIVFLRATTVGLLKLSWDVLCPNCRVSKAQFSTLVELGPQTHCDVCNIVFDTNFDRLVEVRFTVAPSIRDATASVYCVGGPQTLPHVVAQAELDSEETAVWSIPRGVAAMRLRSPQAAATALIEVGAGLDSDGQSDNGPAAQAELRFKVAPEGVDPSSAKVATERDRLAVENRTGATAIVTLEERFWPDTATTAAVVSTLQEFRDLFSADVLAPGLQVGIERLVILFTDVAGSTQMYEQLGQARAFRVVQEHFRFIQAAVRDNRGAIVKTIGDAVMAVFPTVAQALRAAFEMQRQMENIETYGVLEPSHFLKVGIHAGPCLAVTLNDRLDYFGTTVNVAARIEHEGVGGEIVLSREAFLESGVQGAIQAETVSCVECEVKLRGISAETGIVRIQRQDTDAVREAAIR